jgi:uncharacterized RDD family membrane protein YckC
VTVHNRLEVTGHYAGAISRTAAAALDVGIVLGAFAAGVAVLDMLARFVIGGSLVEGGPSDPLSAVFLAVFAFLYVYLSLAIAGRTLGKAIAGLRVVGADGSPLISRRALWRTLALPLSLIPFGLGLVGVVTDREHRALHDLIAGTAVVYDWGGRAAQLPGPLSEFLSRRAGAEFGPLPEGHDALGSAPGSAPVSGPGSATGGSMN